MREIKDLAGATIDHAVSSGIQASRCWDAAHCQCNSPLCTQTKKMQAVNQCYAPLARLGYLALAGARLVGEDEKATDHIFEFLSPAKFITYQHWAGLLRFGPDGVCCKKLPSRLFALLSPTARAARAALPLPLRGT